MLKAIAPSLWRDCYSFGKQLIIPLYSAIWLSQEEPPFQVPYYHRHSI